jgi:hypothetical protein
MQQSLFVVPAFGKVYKTQNQAVKDWHAGKDFKVVNGSYCSIRDSVAIKRDMGLKYVVIFWQHNQQCAIGL